LRVKVPASHSKADQSHLELAKLAAYFWIGRIARYCHLRALAPADPGTRPLAEHRDGGVPRNRRTQHIDVWCGAHDGAAQRHPVRTPLKLERAGRAFPLGGLGLRSHANRGANHRCHRNCSSDCHVVPLVGLASGGLTSKTGRIDVAQPKNYTGREVQLRFVGRMSALGQKRTCAPQEVMSALPPKADMCAALAYVCFGPIADIRERWTVQRFVCLITKISRLSSARVRQDFLHPFSGGRGCGVL